MNLEERLLNKVQMEPNSGCWIWTGYLNRGGYGHIAYEGRARIAHRISYEHFVGPVPNGLDLDHLCRIRCCVNPDHLEPVTRSVNSKRGDTGKPSAKAQKAKTHCPHGHPYSGDNLAIRKNNSRYCKTCKSEYQMKYRRRRAKEV